MPNPSETEQPKKEFPLELEKYVDVLKLAGVKDEDIARVDAISRDPKQSRGRFFGQIAIDEKVKTDGGQTLTKEKFNAVLLQQVLSKATAAELDLDYIIEHGQQKHSKRLQANWGNNKVNAPDKDRKASVVAASALGNMSQNIVVLVNDHHAGWLKKGPEAKEIEDIKAGIAASARLTDFVAGRSKESLSAAEARALKETVEKALEHAAQGVPLTDKAGKKIELKDFIKARDQEIQTAIDARIAEIEQAQTHGAQGRDDGGASPFPGKSRPQQR